MTCTYNEGIFPSWCYSL